MLFAVLHILLQSSDGHMIAALVTRETNVHFKLLHDLGDGLASDANQSAVDAVVYGHLVADLILLIRVRRERQVRGEIVTYVAC